VFSGLPQPVQTGAETLTAARPTQRDQQAPGDPGRRGTAVGEHPRTLGQRLREAAPHVPARSNGGQDPGHDIRVQSRLHLDDQRGDHAVRVGDRHGHVRFHASALDTGDPRAFGAQSADPGVAAGGSARRTKAAGGGDAGIGALRPERARITGVER